MSQTSNSEATSLDGAQIYERAGAIDDYLEIALTGGDAVMASVLAANRAAGLPQIDVSPMQGKFLMLLAKAVGARSLLEIGTLGAYSTNWLARALPPDGHVITLEVEARHAEVAKGNLERAGMAHLVEVLLGPAAGSLPALEQSEWAPFDLVFIDADKPNNALYFDWAVKLCRSGSVIVVDNVVRQGKLAEASSSDPAVVGSRQLIEALSGDARVDATVLQTLGSKGWDGMVIALVR